MDARVKHKALANQIAGEMTDGLYRTEEDRIVAGVCGGIAEYLDVDSREVRIAFVATFVVSWVWYLVGVVSAPTESEVASDRTESGVAADRTESGVAADRTESEVASDP